MTPTYVKPTRADPPRLGAIDIAAPDEPGLPELVMRLVDDARAVARTEVAVYKAKAAERVEAYKGAAIFFSVAGVLALAALIALLVGLIMALATLVGPGWATLIVVVATLAVAGLLGWIGSRKLAPPPALPEPTS